MSYALRITWEPDDENPEGRVALLPYASLADAHAARDHWQEYADRGMAFSVRVEEVSDAIRVL